MSNIKIIQENRKARHDFDIIETYEAGIVLLGPEVKSVKQGRVSLKDSFVEIKDNEAWIKKLHISTYDKNTILKIDPERRRKLLLHKYEIKRLIGKVKEKGLTIVPLKIYLKNNLVKVEIALVKGKRKYEKREELKRKAIEREIERELKRFS